MNDMIYDENDEEVSIGSVSEMYGKGYSDGYEQYALSDLTGYDEDGTPATSGIYIDSSKLPAAREWWDSLDDGEKSDYVSGYNSGYWNG